MIKRYYTFNLYWRKPDPYGEHCYLSEVFETFEQAKKVFVQETLCADRELYATVETYEAEANEPNFALYGETETLLTTE